MQTQQTQKLTALTQDQKDELSAIHGELAKLYSRLIDVDMATNHKNEKLNTAEDKMFGATTSLYQVLEEYNDSIIEENSR